MGSDRKGDIAVIFAATRTEFDQDGYERAAQAMAALAEAEAAGKEPEPAASPAASPTAEPAGA